VSESRGTEEDVASRIKKANGVFVQLYQIKRRKWNLDTHYVKKQEQ